MVRFPRCRNDGNVWNRDVSVDGNTSLPGRKHKFPFWNRNVSVNGNTPFRAVIDTSMCGTYPCLQRSSTNLGDTQAQEEAPQLNLDNTIHWYIDTSMCGTYPCLQRSSTNLGDTQTQEEAPQLKLDNTIHWYIDVWYISMSTEVTY